ncbi:MAG: molybdopterin-binding protein [Desulfobacterales bacterium]|nr:molybdopterin-binding protein [Desulfobacterales bacterium]
MARLNGVGDDLEHLTRPILKEIGGRADVAVVTGGLGPTVDDLSAEAAAAGRRRRAESWNRTALAADRGVLPAAQPADEPLGPEAGRSARGRGHALQPGRHRTGLPPA